MEIAKRSRRELKSFFVKNSIPTESNFAELIDGMLNQREDGLVKLPGNPLSIEAAGDATSVKKLINFYGSFSDASPAWTLTLNPRSDPANPGTARAGLNISDGAGQSRLFIDQETGNIGIGTVEPHSTLDVRGTLSVSGDVSIGGHLKVQGVVATKQVYFSAYVDKNEQSGTRNPLPMQVVSQNVGNGFDVGTSRFTAPVSGVYLFTMTGYKAKEANPSTSLLSWYLMVNDKYANADRQSSTERSDEPSEHGLMSWPTDTSGTASRTILVALKQGDRVHVQQEGSGYCDNFRSGLEGVLIYATE